MMSKKPIDAVVAGHICIDLIPGFEPGRRYALDEIIVPGKLIAIQGASISTGGPVSNTGLPMLKLGADVRLMGKLGDDFFGEAILSLLRERGADEGMTVVKGERTSYTVVIAPPGVDRCFLHDPGANHTFCYEDVDFDLVARAKLFHLGYPPLMARMYARNGVELVRVMRRAKAVGATTSLDMALPDPTSPAGKANWLAILEAVLPHTDVFLPSVEETMYMLDRARFLELRQAASQRDILDLISADMISQMGTQLVKMGAPIVGLKCGSRGLYLRTGTAAALQGLGRARPKSPEDWANREVFEPSFHVKRVASTNGSGDCTIAGFLCAFLRGESLESSARYACAVGAHNVMVMDAVSGVKTWAETTDAIARGWAKNPVKLTGSGWTFNKGLRSWFGPNDRGKA